MAETRLSVRPLSDSRAYFGPGVRFAQGGLRGGDTSASGEAELVGGGLGAVTQRLGGLRDAPECDNLAVSEELFRWYRGRLVVGPFRPFEVGEVECLEREIGLPLPSPYRSFLEAAGGESLTYSVRVPACDPEPFQSFDDLYQLGRDEDGLYGWGTLLGEYRRSRHGWLSDEMSPAGLLPIARNGGSDTLFLDLNLATHGQLHAFVRGIPHPGYLPRGAFTKVADDFDAYLDSLVVEPDLAEDAWADVVESDATDPWRRTVEEWLDKEMPGWRAEPWAAT